MSTDVPAPADLWTTVQWQDTSGAWHNVEGWQGTFDEGNFPETTAQQRKLLFET